MFYVTFCCWKRRWRERYNKHSLTNESKNEYCVFSYNDFSPESNKVGLSCYRMSFVKSSRKEKYIVFFVYDYCVSRFFWMFLPFFSFFASWFSKRVVVLSFFIFCLLFGLPKYVSYVWLPFLLFVLGNHLPFSSPRFSSPPFSSCVVPPAVKKKKCARNVRGGSFCLFFLKLGVCLLRVCTA